MSQDNALIDRERKTNSKGGKNPIIKILREGI